ncbi:cyclin-Q-like [Anneissia japonica]|uniref:cyclin-Q-like n=1 Tax=Anneissia japonica TaxID=1529436 RepID=UPI0014256457|nr:cyclin-Q-like [Anneissia japonica]
MENQVTKKSKETQKDVETSSSHHRTSSSKTHFKVVHFLMEAAVKLSLESVTVASACTFYHRFFHVRKLSNYDPYLIAATCIYLATKVEEQPIRMRDIINVCHRICHKNAPKLEIGPEYWELRESMVNCELLIVRVFQFKLNADLPHKYLLHYLKSLRDWMDTDVWLTTPIARTSMAILCDSFHTDLCLRMKPQHLAVASIYFTLQCYGVEVPCNLQAEKQWWQVFCDDVSEESIQNIILELIDVYQQEVQV